MIFVQIFVHWKLIDSKTEGVAALSATAKFCTATAYTECIRRQWERRVIESDGDEGDGASLHQRPGPVVGDVVSVKTLSTRVLAGLDESMSAKLISMRRQSR